MFIVEPSCSTSSTGQPVGSTLGKQVGKLNWIEPSGWMCPRATVHRNGVAPTMICSSLLLRRYVSRAPENTPATRPELEPFPRTLPAGHADGPWVCSSRSLAVQRSGTLVSYRAPGGG